MGVEEKREKQKIKKENWIKNLNLYRLINTSAYLSGLYKLI